MSELTGILQQIADCTSPQVAITLAKEVGGTVVSIPRHPKAHNKLAKLIGLDNLQAIAKDIGWGEFLIPAGEYRGQGSRKRVIQRLAEDGYSTQEIARVTDCHERTVRRTKSRLRNEAQQCMLPGL